MTTERISGFALILVGLLLIGYSLYSSQLIFTGTVEPPELFSSLPREAATPAAQGIEAQVEQLVADQIRGLIPEETIPQTLNLVMWSVFAGLMFFAGAQIAGIGVKLLSVKRSNQ